jgi:hypothetical protein
MISALSRSIPALGDRRGEWRPSALHVGFSMIESESYAPTAKDRFVHKADMTGPITMQPSQMTVPGKLPCSDDRPLDDR